MMARVERAIYIALIMRVTFGCLTLNAEIIVPDDQPTITAAIAAASENETIRVRWNHKETNRVEITKKGIKLIGETKDPVTGVTSETGPTYFPVGFDAVKAAGAFMPEIVSSATKPALTVKAKDDVQIKNFVIGDNGNTATTKGLLLEGSCENVWVENVRCLGPFNTTANDGFGIRLDTQTRECTIHICTVINGQLDGIETRGTLNIIQYCDVYSDSLTDATDYYFGCVGAQNTFTECVAERRANGGIWPGHGGHGFTVSGTQATSVIGNIFSFCHAKEVTDSFLIRGEMCSGNTFEDCSAYCGPTATENQKRGGNLHFEGSTYNNTVTRYTATNCNTGVLFTCRVNKPTLAPHSNSVSNSTFNDVRTAGIYLNPRQSYNESSRENAAYVSNMTISGCTFNAKDDATEKPFFIADRGSTMNMLTSCSINGFDKFRDSKVAALNAMYVGFVFSQNIFDGVSLSSGIPVGWDTEP